MKWLLLLLLLFSERMSCSERRKPLNFPQRRKRKTELVKWVKGAGRGQNVCQMRKGGEMKRIIHFPAVLHWLLRSPFAAAAPPFPFSPAPPQLQITNTVREHGQFPCYSQHFSVWLKLLNTKALKWIHPGVNHSVEEYINLQLMKKVEVSVYCYANVCL